MKGEINLNLHRIADINVNLGYKYERLKKQAASYKIEDNISPDITICLSDSYLEQKSAENPRLSIGDCEYLYTGSIFSTAIIHFNGFILHSSAVVKDGRAYLFSADSGVGKSTHTSLWRKKFGAENAKILNDDKPAIRITQEGIFAYGTPWSGKTNLNLNMKVPIAGICFLERGEENSIKREAASTVLSKFIRQTIRPFEAAEMDRLLELCDFVLRYIPVYTMKCTPTEEAAEMAYKAMSEGR